MNPEDDPDALVTLTQAETEFEAHAIIATLNEEGIEATAFGLLQSGLSLGTNAYRAVPVQVRLRDLERAKAAIERRVADSVDLDWDQVETGEMAPEAPSGQPLPGLLRGPTLAKFIAAGAVLALIAILAMIIFSQVI